MQKIAEQISMAIHEGLTRILRTEEGQLKNVPNHIIALTVFLCLSVLFQGIADVVLKILSYSPILPELPWRTDFLFLTAISVLMGYRTFTGMRRKKFDVTRNSIELGFLVEVALVIGDSEFIYKNLADLPHVLPMRLPFIILTMINIAILLYTYQVLELRRWPHQQKETDIF